MINTDGMAINIGGRIRALRIEGGTSLRAFAKLLGVSPATLSLVETGKTELSVGRLRRIAELLGIAPEAMLATAYGENPKTARPLQTVSKPEIRNWREYQDLQLDQVLSAALGEFLRAGYHGTSVRDIARAAGLSVSGLYHYYASKQNILCTIFDIAASDLLERANAARDDGRDPVTRFCLLIEHLVLWHCHRRSFGFVGVSEMRSLDARNRREIVAIRMAQQAMVDREVGVAVQQGLFATRHPREAARAVVSMCVAIPTWYRPEGSLSPDQVAAQYIQFSLDVMQGRRN